MAEEEEEQKKQEEKEAYKMEVADAVKHRFRPHRGKKDIRSISLEIFKKKKKEEEDWDYLNHLQNAPLKSKVC